jgi:hypothetical protein
MEPCPAALAMADAASTERTIVVKQRLQQQKQKESYQLLCTNSMYDHMGYCASTGLNHPYEQCQLHIL